MHATQQYGTAHIHTQYNDGVLSVAAAVAVAVTAKMFFSFSHISVRNRWCSLNLVRTEVYFVPSATFLCRTFQYWLSDYCFLSHCWENPNDSFSPHWLIQSLFGMFRFCLLKLAFLSIFDVVIEIEALFFFGQGEGDGLIWFGERKCTILFWLVR